jgi:hypothetical protein
MANKVDVKKLETLAEQRALKKEARQSLVDLTARVMGAEKSRLLERAKSTYGTKGMTLEMQMRALVEDLLIVTRFEEFQMRMVEDSLQKPLEYLKVIALLGPKKIEVEHDFKPVVFLPHPITPGEWNERMAQKEAKVLGTEVIDVATEDGEGSSEGEGSEANPGEASADSEDGGGTASA